MKYLYIPTLMLALLIGMGAVMPGAGSLTALAQVDNSQMFSAEMEGAQEVPAIETAGVGSITLVYDQQAGELRYLMDVQNMSGITAAHLHRGAQGQNGEAVVHLNTMPDGGETEGVIRAADLTGPMAGMSLEDLVNEIRQGTIYVNVHTNQHPQGEIRGQVSGLEAM